MARSEFVFAVITGIFVTTLFLLSGCSDPAASERPESRSDDGKTKKGAKDEGEDDEGGSSSGQDDGDDGSGDGVSSSSKCGGSFSQALASAVSTGGKATAPLIGAIDFTLEAEATIDIKGDDRAVQIGLDADITSFSPSIARSIADKVVSSYKDPLKMQPPSNLQEFYDSNPEWKELECVVLPIVKIENDTYEYEFEPALPVIISSNVDKDLIEASLGSSINLSGITSTVVRHFQPENVVRRGTYEGSAKISASGDEYRIDYDFGTKAPEALATPMAGVSFKIDHDDQSYDGITLRTFVADDSIIDLKVTK